MNNFFAVLIIGFVLLMIVFNAYFRYKILGDYKYLVRNKIEFGASHIFNQSKLEDEVIPRYPKHTKQIRSFCKKIKNALKTALVLIVLVIFTAFVLKNISI